MKSKHLSVPNLLTYQNVSSICFWHKLCEKVFDHRERLSKTELKTARIQKILLYQTVDKFQILRRRMHFILWEGLSNNLGRKLTIRANWALSRNSTDKLAAI
jgi:hypothetical protein